MSTIFGPIVQHGYVVADAERAAHDWVETMGVGPFYVMDIKIDEYYYRGARTDIELRIANGFWGSIHVELIQPLAGNTLYSDAVKTEAGKLNHYATQVDNLDALMATRNLKSRVLQSGSMASGVKFVYLERFTPDGYHLELVQPPPSNRQMFAALEAIAKVWDGKNPIREAGQMADDYARLR